MTDQKHDQAPDLDPDMDVLLQEEAPPLTAIPVTVEGPTRVVQLPARVLVVGQTPVDAGAGVRLFGEDPRRTRLTLIATGTGPMRVGTSQKQVSYSSTSALWPAGVPLEVTAYQEVWVAGDTSPVTVSYIAESASH